MISFDAPDNLTAVEAKLEAQKIAFAPVIFQAVIAMRDLGILQVLWDKRNSGATAEDISSTTGITRYGVKTLLEIGLSYGVARLVDDIYHITKTGYFLINDEMTRVNINFINDVCYKGFFDLKEAIKTGKPEGLKVFGDWDTIYEGLSQLPSDVQTSWFEFDHYYSDIAFPTILPLLFEKPLKKLLDVGGNTGKWAIASTKFDPEVEVTMVDLPGQIAKAKERVAEAGVADRVNYHVANVLHPDSQLPEGADAIWMSQFLDCFSEPEITGILQKAAKVMQPDTSLFILETYWDRQRFEAASLCLHGTSLYFTALANGNSKMYHSEEMKACVTEAGLKVVRQVDGIGTGHTLIECKLA